MMDWIEDIVGDIERQEDIDAEKLPPMSRKEKMGLIFVVVAFFLCALRW